MYVRTGKDNQLATGLELWDEREHRAKVGGKPRVCFGVFKLDGLEIDREKKKYKITKK